MSPLAAVLVPLAQASEPELSLGGFEDAITRLIEDAIPNAAAARLVSGLVFVLIILLLAVLLSAVARRAIARLVDRMKDPNAPRGRRLRAKIGLAEPDTVEDVRRAQRADSLGALARSVLSVVIWTMAVIMILSQVGVQVGPLIAGAGIIGVAVGFGAQDLVRDFLSGVFMLIEDQYGVGDIVDVGQADGVVEGISLRSTRLRDVNGTLWHVPNGEIRRVGNMSQEWARALLDVSVAYGADIDVASELIRRVASEMAHEEQYQAIFIDEPEIWGVQALGADSVDIRLVIKTKPAEQWAVARELRRRLKNAFDAAEVEIPFPQRTVWLRTETPVALGGEQAAPFGHPVPDEAALRRAVLASKRGDTGGRSEFAEMLPDEPEDAADAASASRSGGVDDGEER